MRSSASATAPTIRFDGKSASKRPSSSVVTICVGGGAGGESDSHMKGVLVCPDDRDRCLFDWLTGFVYDTADDLSELVELDGGHGLFERSYCRLVWAEPCGGRTDQERLLLPSGDERE